MHSEQYEELCRRFVAEKESLKLDEVQSRRVPNPSRPGLPVYEHQIDLWWETSGGLATYTNIANAKWRTGRKIGEGDVVLLQKVREKVSAHKAVIITNTGFTRGAIASAKDDQIALHVLKPEFDPSVLPRRDRPAIQRVLDDIKSQTAQPLWSHNVVERGIGFTQDVGASLPAHGAAATCDTPTQTRVVAQPSAHRVQGAPASPGPVPERGPTSRGGGAQGGRTSRR